MTVIRGFSLGPGEYLLIDRTPPHVLKLDEDKTVIWWDQPFDPKPVNKEKLESSR